MFRTIFTHFAEYSCRKWYSRPNTRNFKCQKLPQPLKNTNYVRFLALFPNCAPFPLYWFSVCTFCSFSFVSWDQLELFHGGRGFQHLKFLEFGLESHFLKNCVEQTGLLPINLMFVLTPTVNIRGFHKFVTDKLPELIAALWKGVAILSISGFGVCPLLLLKFLTFLMKFFGIVLWCRSNVFLPLLKKVKYVNT